MTQKKICMLGAFAVGKTSLVSRFVHSRFSDKYHTTVGVKIDKKQMRVDDREVTLIIWDLAGEDELIKVRASYLRGAAGILLVVDGTRNDTLATASALKSRLENEVGIVPLVILVNKADLTGEWELDEDALERISGRNHPVVHTSAKTGDGVEQAFALLTTMVLGQQ